MYQINYTAMRDLDANAYDFPRTVKRFIEIKNKGIVPLLLFFNNGSMGIGPHYGNFLVIVRHLSKVIKENQ